jgi:hypothetical protein
MKTFARLLASLTIVASSAASAGETTYSTGRAETHTKTARDLIRLDASYVFSSELENRFSPFADDDEQDAFHGSIEYSHRFLLGGKIFLRLGVGYGRFEFGETNAPVPEQLFSLNGLVGLEYMVGNDAGAFLYLYPGYYTEDHIGSSSFDMPITVGRAFVLREDRLFFIVGANAAGLRGEFPILPIVGLVWRPSDQWVAYLVPPEPRVTYYPTKNLGIYAGGQLTGGSFRTDRDPTIFPQKLSNAQVDYTEYRAGVGFDFRCNDTISVNVGGGYALQRRFNFERADEEFETDPAPYVRIGLKADF